AAGHVFATVVADAFHHRHGAGVAHGKPLTGDAGEIRLTGDRAIEHGVADDDALVRPVGRVFGRAHDDAAPGQPLADIVVRVADEVERYALRKEGAEGLAGGAGQLHNDG